MTYLSTGPYDAREVANYLLDYSDSRNRALTQISLLKLLYFCHGWYLFYRHRPLVSNDFEAWENGPVVKVVRDAFKHHGKNRITSRAQRLDIFTGEIHLANPKLSPEDAEFIEQIISAYDGFGPWELRDLTHEEGSPWDKLWNSSKVVARMGLRIRNEEILEHFTSKARRNSV